jgi:hypothetical protein
MIPLRPPMTTQQDTILWMIAAGIIAAMAVILITNH